MYLEVYPDIIFVLNFILDFMILSILTKVNRKNSLVRRRLLAAALGGASAVIIGIFPWMNIILRFIFMNVVTSVLMLLIAFGRMKKAELLKQVITLYLITYFIGGLMNSIYYNTNVRLQLIHLGNSIVFSNISWKFIIAIMILLFPAVLILLWMYRCYRSGIREIYDVELVYLSKTIGTKGFMDSGNCLYDPIFKKPVIIMENNLLEKLLLPELYQEYENIKNGMEGNEIAVGEQNTGSSHLLNLRVIPYQSIGKPQGMMLGLVLDKVLIHKGKETLCNEKVTAAVSDNPVSVKEDYHVILHKELL
ncbi:MAG TPA: sigma-E processing peptidase SpoIIGA [Mobilitalea sp.]|nr:sigma-E processing peptidase SpoIIGA [Mobilitalea sp.]